ncbi:MAG: M64 family metallo-endopeptidase [Clostridium sp.]|nr:MAG: M64 family metallo-endopeptidase [Clostridium sp.]
MKKTYLFKSYKRKSQKEVEHNEKNILKKTIIALIIAMMFILAIFFGGEAMKTHTIDDVAKYKMVVNAQGVKMGNGTRTQTQVDLGNYISLDQQLKLTLGPYYSSDGKYSTPTIPVYTIQKTRSDTENMIILICGEGYTKSQQQKFIEDVKRVWDGAIQHEPYRSYADRFNVYALCTASESSFNSGGSTFFDVVIDKKSGPRISGNKSAWKNHIFERCIGPTFLEQIHDAHIPNKTDPDTFIWDDDKMYPPFYYVHKYINQFAVLVNTEQDFGGSHRNYKSGIHYLITPADSPRAQKTFTHELGHGLLELGDEYMTSATESTDYTSLNVAYTHDPEKVKWEKMLGFRKTFTCHTNSSYTAYNSSWECLMRDTTYQFCEVCKLQGSKRMSQLIDGKSLYVADPEVKKYTGQYSQPSDFADTTYNGYANFSYYRSGVLLSGWDKNKFNTDMAGEKIQLRTIVQNLSDTTQRYVTMKLWIKHADGSVATTTGGQRLEATQTFTIPVWSEKSKFWPKGALSYEGSNMNSGLENCELIYQIPLDAVLNKGDTVAFEVTDENGNVLANDNTETQTYANINIEYKFEDGTPMPNVNKATIPIAVGSKLNWTAPSTMFGHTFVRAEGHDQMVNGSDQTVTYYYAKQSNVHIHDWEEWVSNGNGTHTRTCRTDNSHSETANCVGGTATCTHKPVCEVCHGEYGQAKSHDWGKATYTWTDTVCKAERVCKHDSAHTESETRTATGTVIKAATCKEKGKMKYTATFENTAFTKQEKKVDINFAGHTFGKWQDEIPATTEAFGTKGHKDCSVCGRHFDKDGNEITELRIAKIVTHNVIVNGESKFYAHGESVTVTANEPAEGKVFKGWQDASGKIVSTKKSYTFTVNGETNLTAVYEDKTSGGEIVPPAKKDGLSGGQVAGVVIGSAAVAGIGGFAIFWFTVKKKTFADLIAAIKSLFTKKKTK